MRAKRRSRCKFGVSLESSASPNSSEEPKLWLSHRPRGVEWWRDLARQQGHNTFLIAFSRGKDSLSAAIALRDAGFDLIPFTFIGTPGLSFIEDALDYYERNLFGGRHIARVVGPGFLHLMRHGMYALPQWLPVTDALKVAVNTDTFDVHIQDCLLAQHGLPPATMTAKGIRALDNLWRRRILVMNGPVVYKKRQFYTNWDWSISKVIEVITGAGLKLPPDYHLWGHSYFDGQPEFLFAIRKHYPDDYRKILEFFPLMEAAMFRFDMGRR